MKTAFLLVAKMVAVICVACGICTFAIPSSSASWERVETFDGGYSMIRYEGGAVAEEKGYNSDDVLVGYRYTDSSHKTHIVTYDTGTGEEISHTVIGTTPGRSL